MPVLQGGVCYPLCVAEEPCSESFGDLLKIMHQDRDSLYSWLACPRGSLQTSHCKSHYL